MTARLPAPDTLKSCCTALYELPLTTLVLGESFHPGGKELTRRLARSTLIGRGTRVLDVACGRGETARTLVAEYGAVVTGLDDSQQNLEVARGLATRAGLGDHADFIRGAAERLPFDDASFDVVLCECALCTFMHLDDAVQEMNRVLTPGGRVGISDVTLRGPVPEPLRGVLGHALCITGARTRRGYGRAFTGAGFSRVRVTDVSEVLLELVERVERGLARVRTIADHGLLALPDDLGDPAPALAAARALILSGGAGYCTLTATRP